MNLLNLTAATAASVALALSDGTPVEFVKITSKDRIQVRLPASHDLAQQSDGGSDPTLRIFRRDGTHFKDRTSLTLVATAADAGTSAATTSAPATTAAAPAPAPAPVAANDDVTYTVDGQDFVNLDDAKAEAIDIFRDTGNDVEIIATTRKVIGKVGFSLAA